MNRLPQKTIVAALMTALLTFATFMAEAAGLGKLTVNSALGQPLSAEIELVSLQPGEFEAITARVASPEAYAEARIEYSGLLRQLRFNAERRSDGQAILRVTSNAAINEPFLDVLVELSWPSGRLVREYPILLDPPGFNEARIQPPVTPPQPQRPILPTPVVTPPPAQTSPIIQPVLPPIQPTTSVPSARAETGGKDTYGPVKRGDTLAKIANELKPSDVSLDQMLVALLRENRGAFINNNMNLLKTGQILRIPSTSEVAKIARGDAQKEVRVQVADWKAYRDQVAGSVNTSAAKPAATNQATGTVTMAKPVVTAPPAASDQLKIAKVDPAGKGAPGAVKGGDVVAAKDTAVAKQKELAEAQSRIAELEKQKADAQKLAALKADVAKAKPEATQPPPVAVPPPAAVAAAAAKAEAAKSVDAKPTDAKPADVKQADTKPADAAKPGDTKSTEAKPADAGKTPPKAPTKAAPPPAKKEPTWTEMAMDNLPIIGGVAGLGLLGAGGFLFMRRRRSNGATTQSSSLMPSDLKPTSGTGGKAAGLVDTGNSSFLTDFDKAGPGSIDTDEVDPVAEAEVYIAYGRDAQAEEILKEALIRDRNRHEISMKLLEIYHARKSTAAFEEIARELKDAVGDSSPMWAKAASMGISIDPSNPLYSDGQAYEATGAFAADDTAVGGEAAKPDVDFDLGFDDQAAPAFSSPAIDITAPTTDQPAAAASTDGGLDFDLGFGGGETTHLKTPEAAELASGDGGLDFDLGSSGSEASSPAPQPESGATTAEGSTGGFDFDLSSLSLEGDTPAPAAPAPTSAPAADAGMDLSKFSLDLDSSTEVAPAVSADGGGPGAVATKIELAKAYIEIGDTDGAKEILNEVAREGSPTQQDEARKLLAGL